MLVFILLAGFFGCRQPQVGKIDVPLAGISCWTEKDEVRDLAFSGGVIWAATSGGLLKYDLSNGRWISFTMADGLPGNNVLSVFSTQSGDLWIGTDRGAARLDGKTLIRYGPEAGLASRAVNVFAEGSDGTLYAGTERGIARFNGKKWEPFDDTHEFARRPVHDIARDTDGTLWFAKENSLTHYLGGRRWETFQKNILRPDEKAGLISNSLLCIAIGASGTKWIGTKAGLAGYDGKGWRGYFHNGRMSAGKGLLDNWIETVAASGDLIWIGHGNSRDFKQPLGAAYSADGQEWSYLTTAGGLPSDKVYKIRTGPEGNEWIASADGIARINSGRIEKFPPPSGIRSNHAVSVLSGESGGIIALLANGAVEFESSTLKEIPPLEGQKFRGGVVLGDMLICAGMRGGLFTYIRSKGWKEDDFFRGKNIMHLDEEENGMISMVTEDGLYSGRPGHWIEISLADAPAGFRPLKSFRDPGGNMWITGRLDNIHGKGKSVLLTDLDGGFMEVELPSMAVSYDRLNNLIFDGDGRPWLVSPAGLYLFRRKWSELPLPLKKGDLSTAGWDNEGRLWVGTREGGLFLYKGLTWAEILIDGNQAPAWINSIAARENIVWLGTAGQGIFRIDLRTVDID